MNQPFLLFTLPLLAAALSAQTVSIFPDEYVAVPEGPFNSPNRPLAGGTSRVQCLYEAIDISIPSGNQITKIGFRQDGTSTVLNTGRTLQLEIRIGYSTMTAATLGTVFATNYTTAPVTVFGPAAFTLPSLHDPLNPLVNGRFFIPLTTPHTYTPANGNLVVEYLIYGHSGGGTTFSYILDRGDFYSAVTSGVAGCPRSGGGVPSLTAVGIRPGQAYSTSVATAPGNSFGFLLMTPGTPITAPFSLQSMVPGIQPTCLGQVSLAGALQLSGFTSGTGAITWTFNVPNNAAFNDFIWGSQGAFFDLFAPGGVVVTNGRQVLMGVLPRTSINYAGGPPATVTTGAVTRNYNPITFFEHQ
ncbi:MAG: hypothetical protein Q7T30_03535 [Planctomycetota bacterium]|nr:hypothetical protein [Planctomycetota bacterium]